MAFLAWSEIVTEAEELIRAEMAASRERMAKVARHFQAIANLYRELYLEPNDNDPPPLKSARQVTSHRQ